MSLFSPAQQWWRALTATQRKCGLSLVVAGSLLASAGAVLLQPPEIEDLSDENRHELPKLKALWKQGNVVVLVRHLERCDKEDYPCLEGTEGITARSVPAGQSLAESFSRLGLSTTDIYNSPLTRTAQTEKIVFNDTGVDQDWLYQCRETMLSDAMARKKPGKNLVLVTHSSCISEFEEALGYDSETPEYGASLFFSTVDEPGSLGVLGFLDVEDWTNALGSPTPEVASRSTRIHAASQPVQP